MKEHQDLSTHGHQRETSWAAGCKVNSQARIDTLNTIDTKGTNGNMGTLSCPSNGGTVERGRAGAQDAGTGKNRRCKRGYPGLFAKMTRKEEQVTCKIKMERNSCTRTCKHCSACGEGWQWDDNNGGGLTRAVPQDKDVRRWSAFVATRCTRESQRSVPT